MNYKEMFHPDFIDLEMEASSIEEVFEVVEKKLRHGEMVKSGYLQGIIKREKIFPTGLITQYLNIALPHSDPEYVKKPFVFICRLVNEVTCYQMGDNQKIKVKDLFFLGISDGKDQVGLLQEFMDLFMNEEFVKKYKKTTCANGIYQLFIKNIH